MSLLLFSLLCIFFFFSAVLTSEKYGKYEFYFEFRENAGPSAKTYILDVENGSKVKTTVGHH